jgi:hypothetical protein
MAQHRDDRYGRGQRDEPRGQRWRPGEQESSQRGSGGWSERPYSQDEYRTEHPEDFQRGHWQRGYGQDDREAWPSEAGGYQGGPWSSEGGYYRQGGYEGERGGDRGGYDPSGEQGGYRSQREQGRYGQQGSGQGGFRQSGYGGNYGSGGGYGSGSPGYGQGGYGRYGRGGQEQSWGSGSYGAGQGRFGQGGYGGFEQQNFGSGRGYSQGDHSGQGGYGPYSQERPIDSGAQWSGYSGSQHAGRGPKGYKRSDERLKEDISERLMNSGHIDAGEVSVEVQNGKVTLEGTVPDRRMKHQIEDLVDNCLGVQDIDNRVRVSRGESDTTESKSAKSGIGASPTSTFGSSKKE